MAPKEQKIDKIDKKIQHVEMAVDDMAYLVRKICADTHDDFVEINCRGQTLEQIAEEVPSDVYAVITFRRIIGKAVIEGRAIDISSLNFGFSHRTYIDGQIMSINEAKKMPNSDKLISYMDKDDDLIRVIRTRTGSFEPYMQGDRNISLPKKE